MKLASLYLSLLALISSASTSVITPPSRWIIPGNNTYPEGIVRQHGTPYFYTGSTETGIIYRGSLSSSATIVPFINGTTWGLSQALGLHIHGDSLLVAGGASGTLFVFSLDSGELAHRFHNGLSFNESYINDIAIDPETGDAYISDSWKAALWHVPGTAYIDHDTPVNQTLGLWKNLTETPMTYEPDQFNGNGIVLTDDRQYVLLSDTNNGTLYRVDLASRVLTAIDIVPNDDFPGLPGFPIGGIDGAIYEHPYLYSAAAKDVGVKWIWVTEIRAPYLEGRVVGRIENDKLHGMSTIAFVEEPAKGGRREGKGGRDLMGVNFQYWWTGEDLELPFSVVRFPGVWKK